MRLLILSLGILLGAAPARASFRPRTRSFTHAHRAARVTRAAHVAAAPAAASGSPSGGSSFMAPPSGWSTSGFSRSLSGRSFAADDPSAVRIGYFGFSGTATQTRAGAVSQTNASAAGSPIAIDEARMTPIPGYAPAANAGVPSTDRGSIPTIRGMADAMTAALDQMLSSMFGKAK